MTLRIYQGWARHAERPSRRYLGWLTWLALLMTSLAQFLFPFLNDTSKTLLLMVGTYSAAGLALLHAFREFGGKYFARLGVSTLLFGFLVFWSSARTSWPFGHVIYASSLGARIDGAPVLLPFALLAMAYPMLLVGRRLTERWPAIVGGIGFLAGDLLVDPVLNQNGYWRWDLNVTRTPGIPGTPLSNTAGTLLIGIAIIQILHWLFPRERGRGDRWISSAPIDLLLLIGCTAGIFNNLYLGNTSVALVGGALFLIVLVPYMASKWLARA